MTPNNNIVPNINNTVAVLIIVIAIIAVTVFNNILSEIRTETAQEQRDAQTAEIVETQRELDRFAKVNTNETRQILDRLVDSIDKQNDIINRQHEIIDKLDQIVMSNLASSSNDNSTAAAGGGGSVEQ